MKEIFIMLVNKMLNYALLWWAHLMLASSSKTDVSLLFKIVQVFRLPTLMIGLFSVLYEYLYTFLLDIEDKQNKDKCVYDYLSQVICIGFRFFLL